MKTELEKRFIRCMRRREAMLEDGVIALVPSSYLPRVMQLEGAKSMAFDIIDLDKHQKAGEIALRLGDGAAMFYLGHIGYHIDPPYRGNGEALHACKLCLPLLKELYARTFVITTDDDNLPSIRTCERLGCVLECRVQVPMRFQRQYGLSSQKRRYIYEAR